MENEPTDSTPEARRPWRRVLIWPASLIVVGLHLFWGDEAYSPEALITAGLIGCIAAVSIAYARPRVLPAVPILLAYFYVAMARPTFSPPFIKAVRGPIWLSSHSYELALIGCLIFAVALVIGSWLVQGVGRRAGDWLAPRLDPPEPYLPSDTSVARVCAAVMLAFYVFVNLRPSLVPPSISFAVSLFSSPAIPLGLLFWDAHRTNRPGARLLFWSVVSFTALLGLSSGTIGNGVLPGLIAASLLWTATGRVPVGLILIGTVVLLVLNPAKHRYRQLTWYQDRDIGLQERAESWVEALSYTYSAQTDAAIDASLETTAHRTSTLPAVALVMENVPLVVPHAGPKRWLELPLMFIPRVVWPAKPSHTETFNNDFTLTFGLQTPRGVETTTLNLPSVADGYWRLGWPGVFLEGLFLGIMLGLFQGAHVRSSRALLILGVGFTVSTQADKHVFQILASFPQYVFATAMMLLGARLVRMWLASQKTSNSLSPPAQQPAAQ